MATERWYHINAPHNMNLTPVRIRPHASDETVIHGKFKVPLNKKAEGSIINVEGQVVFKKEGEIQEAFHGRSEDTKGYVSFKKKTLHDSGITINFGDIFIQYKDYDGWRDVDYSFYDFKDTCFIGGKPRVLTCYFKENITEQPQ
jgi:hypothetical protein